jgi:hypothetical protein
MARLPKKLDVEKMQFFFHIILLIWTIMETTTTRSEFRKHLLHIQFQVPFLKDLFPRP